MDSFPGRVVRRFGEDGGTNQAIVVAWNSLTALFPIVLALATIAGFVLGVLGAGDRALDSTLLALIPDDRSREAALRAVEGVKQRAGLLAVVALVSFVWSGSSLFGAMEQAFDAIFRIPNRGFVRQKLMALAMMGIFCVLIFVAVATSAVLPLLGRLPGIPAGMAAQPLAGALQFGVGTVSGFGLFYAIYRVVPNRRQRFVDTWRGALFAGVAFELLTLLFPLYVRFNGGLNQYGASFALLFILLTFFYLLGMITMLGVEVNAVAGGPATVPRGRARAGPPQQARRAPQPSVLVEPRRRPAAGRRRNPVKQALLAVLAAGIGLFAVSRRRSN